MNLVNLLSSQTTPIKGGRKQDARFSNLSTVRSGHRSKSIVDPQYTNDLMCVVYK